jgi:hypothetical protein
MAANSITWEGNDTLGARDRTCLQAYDLDMVGVDGEMALSALSVMIAMVSEGCFHAATVPWTTCMCPSIGVLTVTESTRLHESLPFSDIILFFASIVLFMPLASIYAGLQRRRVSMAPPM